MKRAVEGALALVAALLVGAFLLAAVGGAGWTSPRRVGAKADPRYFHSGKTDLAPAEEVGCRAGGCHAGMPHARERAEAAFRNMHVRFVGCMVCHGRESSKTWSVGRQARGPGKGSGEDGIPRVRWTISAPTPPADRDKPHAPLGPAVACRACHSEQGYREIGARGARELPAAFADPVALRMIEGGAKQWIPDPLR